MMPAPASAARARAGIGPEKQLVILVSFADQDPVGSTAADWAEKYFGKDTRSVADYYDEASGGKFALEPAEESSG